MNFLSSKTGRRCQVTVESNGRLIASPFVVGSIRLSCSVDAMRFVTWVTVALGFLACCFLFVESAHGQIAPRVQAFQIDLNGMVQEELQFAELEAEVLERDRAVLKTDPELESLMQKADRYRNDGNYRVATTLWQAVLNRSGDSLYSDDQEIYHSMVQRVEKVLALLPAEGLEAYRVTADASAREILATASPLDTSALAQVVQKYFMSSVGDDAAWKLGSIFIDRYNFSDARRLLQKIAKEHPDPSVALDQVYLKIAFCHSWLGDADAAEAALAESVKAASDAVQPRHFELVNDSIGELDFDLTASETLGIWEMPLGNAARLGVMPAPPRNWMDGPLVAGWQYYFQPRNSRPDRRDFVGVARSGEQSWGESNKATRHAVEIKLIEAWKRKKWRPSGELLFDDARIFYRSFADITAWDKKKITALIDQAVNAPPEPKSSGGSNNKSALERIQQSVAWRSVWRNSFELDLKTLTVGRQVGPRSGRGQPVEAPNPVTLPEVQLFGDKIASCMSIDQDTLYAVEGKRFDYRNITGRRRPNFRNYSYRRTRENYLTAYDRKTGELKWSLPEVIDVQETEDVPIGFDKTEDVVGGGFMAAPIGFGDLIIVPVNLGGAIHAYALDPTNGKTVWKSFLCDESETGANAWSPIEMSISGGDLFVSCGMGVVFAVDAASGVVRFAKRYQREGRDNPFANRSSRHAPRYKFFEGWTTDTIVPWGDQMICFSSDRSIIEAYDRADGKMRWQCDTNPLADGEVDYVIGIYNDVLYAGGYDTIIAFDLNREGEILWGGQRIFGQEQSRGKAMLTSDGIFVPVEDTIIQFSLTGSPDGTAHEVAAVKVYLGTEAPVGNLYSDGERIWVHGANRLYALQPSPENK